MKNLEAYFIQFGLSKNESELYLALLKNGPSTILELAKITNINRTTVHINIESLEHKGLVTGLKRGKRRYITAESPEKFKILLEEEKSSIENKSNILSDMMNEITKQVKNVKENTTSEVRYYEGKPQIERLYDYILESKEIRAYVNSKAVLDTFPENTAKFIKAFKKGLKVKDIFVYETENQSFNNEVDKAKLKDNYEFRTLPPNYNIQAMDYMIFDKGIAIIYLADNPSAILINNPILVTNSKSLFDLVWELISK